MKSLTVLSQFSIYATRWKVPMTKHRLWLLSFRYLKASAIRYNDELWIRYIFHRSPHGSMYAVVDSVAKVVATGGDYKIRFTFEYFRRMTADQSVGASRLQLYLVMMQMGWTSINRWQDEHKVHSMKLMFLQHLSFDRCCKRKIIYLNSGRK